MVVSRKMMQLLIKRNSGVGKFSSDSGTSYKKFQEPQKLLASTCGSVDKEILFLLTKSFSAASREL